MLGYLLPLVPNSKIKKIKDKDPEWIKKGILRKFS
jgi:hypothetical protein